MPKGTFRSIVTDIASGLAGCVLAVCAGAPTRAALPRTQPAFGRREVSLQRLPRPAVQFV